MAMTILAGPTGTRLIQLGFDCDADERWSARAVDEAPALVAQVHQEYAAAGADVHPTVTFRTTRRNMHERWRELTARAVDLCRGAMGPGQRIAGALAPIEDCYAPDAAPPSRKARAAHREMADHLVSCGCDLILCETFPGIEGLWAAEGALQAGAGEVWASFTPGPKADLLTPAQVAQLADAAVGAGAAAALVNCAPAGRAGEYVAAIADAVGGRAHIGVYANVYGANATAPEAYAELAESWVGAGASIVGACCGAGPEHIRALVRVRG
ncbi:MAG: homocysteine S-methyltransferase family protein [Phycisphaerales bacterium JB039]